MTHGSKKAIKRSEANGSKLAKAARVRADRKAGAPFTTRLPADHPLQEILADMHTSYARGGEL